MQMWKSSPNNKNNSNELLVDQKKEFLPYINGHKSTFLQHTQRHLKVEQKFNNTQSLNSLNSSFHIGKQYGNGVKQKRQLFINTSVQNGNPFDSTTQDYKYSTFRSPQCSQIESYYSKKKVPTSTLSMTKYRFLLTDNDKEKDQIHFPINKPQENNQKIQQDLQLKQAQSTRDSILNEQQNIDITKDYQFLKFNLIKKHNKSQLQDITSKYDNLKEINLDVSQEEIQNYQTQVNDNLKKLNKSHRVHKKNYKKGEAHQNHDNYFYQKYPIQIQQELIHNKYALEELKKVDQQSQKKMQKKLLKKQQIIESKIKNTGNYRVVSSLEVQERQQKLAQKSIPQEINSPQKSTHDIENTNTNNNKQKESNFIFNTQKIHGILNNKLDIFWYYFDQFYWKPPPRELATMVCYKGNSYLFGGLGKTFYNDMCIMNNNNFRWEICQTKGVAPCARLGHTMNLYKNNLVIFGGEKQYNSHMKKRECLLDVHFFQLETKTWVQQQCTHIFLQQRRNHQASVVGKQLIVHGGINIMDKTLDDLWILDLVTLTWSEVNFQGTPHQGAFHKNVAVYYPIRKNIQIYKPNDYKPPKFSLQLKYEGIYSFGGKNQEGDIHGHLRILLTDQQKLKWIEPQTYGVSPSPRYGHSMHYHEKFNFLVVCGGKFESETTEEYLNDLFIMDLQSFNWVDIQFLNEAPKSSFNHCSAFHEGKLIIFGGICQNGFQSDIKIAEIDSLIGRKVKENEKMKKQLPWEEKEEEKDEKQNKQQQQQQGQGQKEKHKLENAQSLISQETHDQQRIQEKEEELERQNLMYHNLKTFQPLPSNGINRRRSSLYTHILFTNVIEKAKNSRQSQIYQIEEYQ